MSFTYADNVCRDCGKRIVVYKPKHDLKKPERAKAHGWVSLQTEHLVRCVSCSRDVLDDEMQKLKRRGVLDVFCK